MSSHEHWKAEIKKKKEEEAAAKKQSRTKRSNAKAKMVPVVSNIPSDSDSQGSGEDDDGVQSHEILNNECAVCFGLYSIYQDDLSSTGKLLTEWVECTNAGCKKWMHAQCLQLSDELYIFVDSVVHSLVNILISAFFE